MYRLTAPRCRFSVELLESRLLFAGNVTVRLNGTNLMVYGDVNNNVLAITSGIVPNSIVVSGLTDYQNKPTKINGQANGAVQFNGVTGSIFANLGRGLDVLGLTNLNVTRDVKITDLLGNSQILIGTSTGASRTSPLGSIVNGPIKIMGNLSITTGEGNDTVKIGEFGNGSFPAGAAVRIDGSLNVSLGNGGPQSFIGARDAVFIGGDSRASGFLVSVGTNAHIDLGPGVGRADITSLEVMNELSITSSNIGPFTSAGVSIGGYQETSPPALRVGGDANISLGIGAGDFLDMNAFAVLGNLMINLPSLYRYTSPDNSVGCEFYSGYVGGTLSITVGTAGFDVYLSGISADHLEITGSDNWDGVIIGATELGRRSTFGTATIHLGAGSDFIQIEDATVVGLALLDGGTGDDSLYVDDPESVIYGQLVRTSF